VPTAVTFDSSTAAVGQQVSFDSGVQNLGDRDAGVFGVEWLVDGQDVGACGGHDPVPANTTVLAGNSQFAWTFTTPGSHTVTWIVDVNNNVVESRETNNSRSVTVTITP
jgi:subtilase family serine protease